MSKLVYYAHVIHASLPEGKRRVLKVILDIFDAIPSSIELIFLSLQLTPSSRATIIIGMCEGLLLLHSKDIVHQDLKPENVMVSLCILSICTLHAHCRERCNVVIVSMELFVTKGEKKEVSSEKVIFIVVMSDNKLLLYCKLNQVLSLECCRDKPESNSRQGK